MTWPHTQIWVDSALIAQLRATGVDEEDITDVINDAVGQYIRHRVNVASERYTTGTGRVMRVHARAVCVGRHCSIHNPSPEAEAIGVTHWRGDRGLMERICAHGVGHPDPDHMGYLRRIASDPYDSRLRMQDVEAEAVHACDGCCTRSTAAASEA